MTMTRGVLAALTFAAVAAGLLRAQTPEPTAASLGDRIPLVGLAADGRGVALWNTGVGAPETEKTGHLTPWTSCSTAAPYYLATRDHSTLDAVSTAGFIGVPPIAGLGGFADALAANGFTTADIAVGWSVQSLGGDVEGADWSFDDATGVETRFYTGGVVTLSLRGEPLARGNIPTTTVTTTYNDRADCDDDLVALATGVVLLANDAVTTAAASVSSEPVQAVVAALIASLDGNGVSFGFDALSATGQAITESGRTGVFLEAADGRAEVAPPCSCAVGLHDEDNTHDWTLLWPETALPANGPVRLKLDAVIPPPDPDGSDGPSDDEPAPDPGRVTLTVFDDSAPTQGVILDVAFPAGTGEASGTVELTIQPQTEYRVTVTRSSALGSGRYYRLGASHQTLRLGQSDQRYLDGVSQDWGIEAAAGETVTLELATDTSPDELSMAASAFVTLVDPATGAVLDGPNALSFTPGTPRTVTFQNSGDARRIVAQVDPDGRFRMRRTDGDATLYSLACPTRSGLAFAPLSQVQTDIFDAHCTQCHGSFPRGGLDLRPGIAFGQLVNIPSSQSALMRVVPGDSETSYLIHKLEGRASIAGSRMPQGGPFLTETEIALVRGWIRGGAPDTSAE